MAAAAVRQREQRPPGARVLTASQVRELVPAVPQTLRALTFNIRHGMRDGGVVDLPAVADALRAGEADLIALQEVDVFQLRSGLADQPAWLAQGLGLEYIYGATMRRGLGEYGNVLLSRYPVISSRLVSLPAVLEPRGAIIARVRAPAGDVTVAVTHLGLAATDREVQVQALLEALAEEPGPYLLLGDFNAEAGAPELAPLAGSFQDAFAAAGLGDEVYTLRTVEGEPVAASDRVFISPELSLRDATVLPHQISDHNPVVVTVVLPAPK